MQQSISLAITSIAMGSCIRFDDDLRNGWTEGGQVELFAEFAKFALISNQMADKLSKENVGFPGVYVYEVDEVFAQYVINSIKTAQYDKSKAKVKLGEIAYDFFSQSPDLSPTVVTVIYEFTGFKLDKPITAPSS
jgi:hypothetical protein